jgi:hypothetical protein
VVRLLEGIEIRLTDKGSARPSFPGWDPSPHLGQRKGSEGSTSGCSAMSRVGWPIVHVQLADRGTSLIVADRASGVRTLPTTLSA